jgi:iron complex transport system substrate-binding protein
MKSKKIGVNLVGLLLVFALVFTVAGCSSTAKTSTASAGSSASDTSAKTAVFTDMLGRKVTLTTNVQRIVLVRTMDIYMLSSVLGNQLDDKLIAVGESFKESDIDGYNKLSQAFHNLDKMVNVGSIYDNAINLETMIKLKPDIIIADKQFYGYACLNKMIEAGLPVVFTDDNTDPFHGTQKSMEMLGKMLGTETKVNAMVKDADAKTDAVLKRVQDLEAAKVAKPKLYFECGNVSASEIGGTRGDTTNGWGLVWKTLGADNIGVGSKSDPLNPEKVLTADPDIIVIGGANWSPNGDIMRMGFSATQKAASDHLGEYSKRAGWSDLAAIKNDRLYSIHFNVFIYPYNFVGTEAMAKMLYPDQFKDIDPQKDMKDFISKYMPYSYSGAFWARWKQLSI